MRHETLLLLSAVTVVVSLLAAILAWATSVRWAREYKEAADRAQSAKDQLLRAGDEKSTALAHQVEFLKELDSVRFAQRYIETKHGLDTRVEKLLGDLRSTEARGEAIRQQMEQLSIEDQAKADEIGRLRSELIRAHQESQRLEQVMQTIQSVGPIPTEELKSELAKRLRTQAEIKGRLEQFSLEGIAKSAELERLRAEAEELERDARRLEREIEVTRSAGPILDGLLGITTEMREKMSRIGDRLRDPLWHLSSARPRDPVAELLRASQHGHADRGRLLVAGLFAAPESEPAHAAGDQMESSTSSAAEANTLVPESTTEGSVR